MKSEKVKMLWAIFYTWASTIALTFVYLFVSGKIEILILSAVSTVFAGAVGWLFQLRKQEKVFESASQGAQKRTEPSGAETNGNNKVV